MRDDDYKVLRELLDLRYQSKRDALEAEYKRDIADLERIFSRFQEPIPEDKADFVRPVSSLVEAVESVLSDIDSNFDINTVINLIQRKHPEIKTPINPTSISGILRNLAKKRTLRIVTAGVGTKPTIYRVAKAAEKYKETA
jgi:hypothetical protein